MDILNYRPLLWLLLLVPLLAVFTRSLVTRQRWLKISSFVLRCVGIVLLILALCGPFISRWTNKAHVIFLVDVSESVDVIVTEEGGKKHSLPMQQVGLGLYETKLPDMGLGRYTVRLHDTGHGKVKVLHHHADYPAEYRLDRKPAPAFTTAAGLGQNRISEGLGSVAAKEPIAASLRIAAILCLIAGILLRRI